MALAVLRTPLCRVSTTGSVLWKGRSVSSPVLVQAATLRATHGEKYPYPKEPFPYETKRYTWWRQILGGHTRHYLCENSKVITVDGNIGVGKNAFAERLSKEFDLKFFPSLTDADIYINNNNGLDMRIFNKYLTDSAKFYDLETFVNDKQAEASGRAALLQLYFYVAKFRRYCKALLHLLSTGQGVVIVNSVYSDDAFLETLKDCGYIKPNFYKNYYNMRDNTICELNKPHLAIYLDAPLSTIRKNLDKTKDPLDARCTDKYIKAHEKNMNVFKNRMRASSEVMEIDWTETGDELDMDWISSEMSRLRLESENNDDPKFHDWYNRNDDDLDALRVFMGNSFAQDNLFKNVRITMDSPEIYWSEEDQEAVDRIVLNSPAYYGRTGFLPEFNRKDNPYLKLW